MSDKEYKLWLFVITGTVLWGITLIILNFIN